MSEETKEIRQGDAPVEQTVKKSWFNRVWAAVVGLVVGVGAMFGINQAQINDIKEDATKAYEQVQTTITAIQDKKYLDAIESGRNAINTLQTITGEVKEAINTAKDSAEQYKTMVLELKAATDAKDWKNAAGIANNLLAKLTENVPAETLTGKPKQVYDLVVEILGGINEGKYDPIVDLINRVVALTEKTDDAPVTE